MKPAAIESKGYPRLNDAGEFILPLSQWLLLWLSGEMTKTRVELQPDQKTFRLTGSLGLGLAANIATNTRTLAASLTCPQGSSGRRRRGPEKAPSARPWLS